MLFVYVGLELGVGNRGFSYLVQARGLSRTLAGYSVSGFWLGLTAGSTIGGAGLPWVAGAIAQATGIWTLMPYTVALAVVQIALHHNGAPEAHH